MSSGSVGSVHKDTPENRDYCIEAPYSSNGHVDHHLKPLPCGFLQSCVQWQYLQASHTGLEYSDTYVEVTHECARHNRYTLQDATNTGWEIYNPHSLCLAWNDVRNDGGYRHISRLWNVVVLRALQI